MQGNIDLIIDIAAKNTGMDRAFVEAVAKETFLYFKSRMQHSEAVSLHFPGLGKFTPMYSKLRGYTRLLIKKIRTTRKAIASNRYKGSQLDFLIQKEKALVHNFRVCWRQIETYRILLISKRKSIKIKNEKKAQGISTFTHRGHYQLKKGNKRLDKRLLDDHRFD
jgi:hypothetical protein